MTSGNAFVRQKSENRKQPLARPAIAAPKASNVAVLFLLEYAPAYSEDRSSDVLLDGFIPDL